MKIGYARVSTRQQNLEMQIEAFKKEGCEKVYTMLGYKMSYQTIETLAIKENLIHF